MKKLIAVFMAMLLIFTTFAFAVTATAETEETTTEVEETTTEAEETTTEAEETTTEAEETTTEAEETTTEAEETTTEAEETTTEAEETTTEAEETTTESEETTTEEEETTEPLPDVVESLELCVYPFDDDSTVIRWWFNENDSSYYIFLPADADKSALRLGLNCSGVMVGEKLAENGTVTDAFADGDTFTVTCGEKEYPVIVMQSANIPSMYITTKSGSLDYIHADKSNKEKATITIAENGELIMVNDALKQIKGRGNSTWEAEKKPYNITFDKKTDLFGMGKAKKWSLLASYYDDSLLRNDLALYLAEEMGIDYTSQSRHVDLYINGEYLGNYVVIESIEIGSTRVDINDLAEANEEANPDVEDIEELPTANNIGAVDFWPTTIPGAMKWVEIPNDPDDISGGYLLELDFHARYAEEVSGFVTYHGQCVVVKEPEYASKAQVEYVSRLWNEAEEAFYSETGYNSLGKHYSDYFDMAALAKMFILEEFAEENDAGRSSNYFYLAQGSDKFVAAPVWDFDGAFGRRIPVADVTSDMPDIWFAATRVMDGWLNGEIVIYPTIFNLAFRHADFRAEVERLWNEYEELYSGENLNKFITDTAALLNASANMNTARWFKVSGADETALNWSYSKWTGRVRTFATERTDWLDTGFSSEAAFLYYDLNGGKGFAANYQILTKGQRATVSSTIRGTDMKVTPASEEYCFTGWNTEKDGTGTAYRTGEKITLTDAETVLYAQWKKLSDCIWGDVDSDGELTAADARLALRASVELEIFYTEPGTAAYIFSDVNGDGKITAADARLILRKSVGFTDSEFTVK